MDIYVYLIVCRLFTRYDTVGMFQVRRGFKVRQDHLVLREAHLASVSHASIVGVEIARPDNSTPYRKGGQPAPD